MLSLLAGDFEPANDDVGRVPGAEEPKAGTLERQHVPPVGCFLQTKIHSRLTTRVPLVVTCCHTPGRRCGRGFGLDLYQPVPYRKDPVQDN